MPRPRVLPDADVLRNMLERGITQREIAEQFGTTRQAVSYVVRERNLVPAPVRYDPYIPWKIKDEHGAAHELRILRAYARARMGLPNTVKDALMLERYIARMADANAVIDYDPEVGFYVTERRPGVDDELVRDPRVSLDNA